MLDKIRHRGADGQHFITFQADAQRALRPALDQTSAQMIWGQNWSVAPDAVYQYAHLHLLLDGAIYNHLELRQRWLGQHSFQTPDQTETLLLLYETLGPQAFNYLEGNWALVLFDEQTQQLIVCRDRVGISPFYYFYESGTFAFASEQKALLALPFVEAKMSRTAVFDFFFLQQIEGQTGFFEGIEELRPGHYLTFDLQTDGLETKPYFQLTNQGDLPPFDQGQFDLYTEKVRSLLQESIRVRIPRDKPSALLSGGLDSSVLVTEIARQRPAALQTFTAAFRDPRFDESQYAQRVAAAVGAQWTPTYPKRESLEKELETLAYCHDIPLTSAGTYAQFCAMRAAADQGAKTIFDGQGADALFGGHLPHQALLWWSLWRQQGWRAMRREMQYFGPGAWQFLLRILMKNAWLPQQSGWLRHRFNQYYFSELAYFQPDFVAEHRERYALYQQSSTSQLNAWLQQEYTGSGMRFLLKCVDRSAAWHGLRPVMPYVDNSALMQTVFQVPANFKLWNGEGKHLLREAFRSQLPPAVLERRDKKALATPNNLWIEAMRPHIKPYFEALPGDVFQKEKLLRDFTQFFTTAGPFENYRVFKFIGFAVWRKVFQV